MSQAPPPKLNLRKLESIQRLLQYGAAAVLLVFLALIAFSAYKLIQINRQIDAKQTKLAQLTQTIEKQKQELVQSNETIERQDVTLETLINPNQPLSKEQAEQVEETVEENIKENNAALIPPRVYIQIGREDQRKRAGEIARRLHAEGYLAPGVENVHEKAPRTSELRYYQTDEVAQNDIRNLLEFFRGIGVHLGKPVQIRKTGAVRPRHYEIWFGDDFGRPARPIEPETKPTVSPQPTRRPTPEPTTEPTRRPRPRPTRIF